MQQTIQIKASPEQLADDQLIRPILASRLDCSPVDITGFQLLRKSLDARGRQISYHLTYLVFIGEPYQEQELAHFEWQDVHRATRQVIIIGGGPAGLFAALRLIEAGIRPIILERGKDVKARRRDLATLNKSGIVDPESNYCFGEGGAGTYSDGKLYTRSYKRGNIERALQLFVHFGADPKILYENHPHIGTNKLPQIITAIRLAIEKAGGQVIFGKKVVDFTLDKSRQKITEVRTSDGDCFNGEEVILATGHSARDIFLLLQRKQIMLEAKPFALGVRVEHPQTLINELQYHGANRQMEKWQLPPASYSLVQQVADRGVFSFCMCPGGIIAPAATSPGELVVNGWSPSKRNNPYANSGMVVQVNQADACSYLMQLPEYKSGAKSASMTDPLLLMHFQQKVEQLAFQAGGGGFKAPAQRMTDFVNHRESASLPDCSYIPGLTAYPLEQILPPFISRTLAGGLKAFGKKMKGYMTSEANLVATESRTSSPVRIPRNQLNLQHPDIQNLYPCAEGAGYAGGIISAVLDGIRIAEQIQQKKVTNRSLIQT